MNDLSRALSNPTLHDENGAVSWSSGLPTGAVTLLMTDIEGSTPMWDRDGDRAAAAVALHRQFVEAAIESHNGVRPEEQGEGDSVVSAFARPSDALAAVVDLQLALGDADWGDGAVVRVRAAVHAGEISVRDEGNYQGPTIIRAARIRDAGHGGQTLISAAARALVADHVPDGVSFVDLGQHRLKGLDRPEHLWQVCHPRLGSDFPPLRSLSRPANNLPTPSSPLVGRGDALAELSALVASHQVVTLCGTGGCGKTRLAMELASAVAADDPARASWVPLAAVSRDDHVVSAVADALGVHEVHDEAVIETVLGELRGRCAVLVLDNCEQVLDGVSELVDRLVAALPDVHVIVTSREALGLSEERSWRVPSLDVPASVELFVARASSVRPSFPAAAEREAIEQICERLDGVPLAIELAAARTRMMSPRRIAEGLDDRFRLLTGGARTALPRQQTLEASVEWSHHLLDDSEQAVLRRLAVFKSGFTLEAAEAVGAGGEVDRYEVLDVLTRLVDKSLVQAEDLHDDHLDDIRYRLLETIRLFALSRLAEAGEADGTRGRHLDYFLQVAETSEPVLQRSDGIALLAVLEVEHDNCRAALEWADASGDPERMLRLATALSLFWELRGHLGEGCRWFARALAHEGGPSVARARALWGAAHVAVYNEDVETARRLANDALEMAVTIGDRWTEARALNSLGYASAFWGAGEAVDLLDRSIALGRELHDDWVVADGLKMLTIERLTGEDLEELTRVNHQLRDVATHLGNSFFLAWAVAIDGLIDLRYGDLAAARAKLERSIALCGAIGDPATGGVATWWLAETEARAGDPDGARARIDQFVAHANATGGHMGVAPSMLTLVQIMLGGTEQEGARLFAEAMAADLEYPPLVSWASALHGAACRALGDDEAARSALERALQVARRRPNGWFEAIALHELGLLERSVSEWGEAERRLHEALAVRHSRGNRIGVVETLEALAAVAADLDSHAEAARLYAAAVTLRQEVGLGRWAADRDGYDADVERLRVALGDDFARCWDEGSALDMDEAVAYASRARGERKRPSIGWASLTPTEERVVALVAEGLTNPQIGERLFISKGTVKTHLSHVFAKLGATTRAELAATWTRRTTAHPNRSCTEPLTWESRR